MFAAVVTQDLETLATLETGTHEDLACFPYLPGLFSFREIPPLAEALAKQACDAELALGGITVWSGWSVGRAQSRREWMKKALEPGVKYLADLG